jgi:hypothetical protein
MKEVFVSVKGLDVDYEGAHQMTMGLAKRGNADAALLAWFDKKKDRHSPSIVECNAAGLPGWEEYGRYHGGRLKFAVNDGEYVLVYT